MNALKMLYESWVWWDERFIRQEKEMIKTLSSIAAKHLDNKQLHNTALECIDSLKTDVLLLQKELKHDRELYSKVAGAEDNQAGGKRILYRLE